MEVVCAIIINAEKKVFAARRKEGLSFEGYWEFPGGKIEKDEDAVTAIERELQEELNLKLSPTKELHRLTGRNKNGEFELIAFAFQSELEGMKLSEHDESAWCSIEELLELNLMVADMALLPQVEPYLNSL